MSFFHHLLAALLTLFTTTSADIELVGPGVISTPLDELNSTFSPDGRELYFSINTTDNSLGTIVISHRVGTTWSPPVVAPFSGQFSDYDPAFTADGQRIIFISNRPVGTETKSTQDYDLWSVDRVGSGWGAPHNLGAPINTTAPEYSPSIAADGTLYFSSRRDDSKGHFNLYRSRLVDGKYGAPENLGPTINGDFTNIDNAIAPDQSFIIFVSYGRPDGLGSGDLYISFNQNGAWTAPKHLAAPINSAALEYAPTLSPDGKYLYWTSKRGFATERLARALTAKELRDSLQSIRNGNGNIYRAPLQPILDANR
jgi:Tol biopolymer transport system component